MTPMSQLLAPGSTGQVNSSAAGTNSPASPTGQPMPTDPSQQGGQSVQPDLAKLAAIRDELLRMRSESPAMAPYIDAAIQALVDGLSTTMQDPSQQQGMAQGQPNAQAPPMQGDSSYQPNSYQGMPY